MTWHDMTWHEQARMMSCHCLTRDCSPIASSHVLLNNPQYAFCVVRWRRTPRSPQSFAFRWREHRRTQGEHCANLAQKLISSDLIADAESDNRGIWKNMKTTCRRRFYYWDRSSDTENDITMYITISSWDCVTVLCRTWRWISILRIFLISLVDNIPIR